ncbi:hypothetical protein F5Y03DRAFT_347853 [Xylaria venustula]|nr:hypothetical protein F5Y03DRAFT_347853 [Xylaria venustula]
MYMTTPSVQLQLQAQAHAVMSSCDLLVPLLAPLHLLSFSTLLGSQLYQTFLVTKITHASLPRSAFTTLQKRLFPIYFRGQSLLLLLTVATVPPHGPFTVVADKAAWIPFAIAGITAILNYTIYGPRTRQIMMERIHQETRDALQKQATNDSASSETPSPEMQSIRRSFARNHAMSIHLNLLTIGAMLWWGYKLASNLNLERN